RPRIESFGRYIVFVSQARNLVAGQNEPAASETSDVFLWERASGAMTLVSRKEGSPTTPANGSSGEAELSMDANFVVFSSAATDLVTKEIDTNGDWDVFVFERTLGTVSRVSSAPPSSCSGRSSNPKISLDSRIIVFESSTCNLVPGQIGFDTGLPDAFVYTLGTGVLRLASHVAANPIREGGIESGTLGISADGHDVVFTSRATNLVLGQVDDNGEADVFVYNYGTNETRLVSRSPASPVTAAGGSSGFGNPSISAEGHYIAFQSSASGLVSGQIDRPNTADVFLYDLFLRNVVLVSLAGSSIAMAGNGPSVRPVISPDGSAVAFHSVATDLGDGENDPNFFQDLFLYSRTSGEVESLSRRDPGLPPSAPHGPSSVSDLSADGRFVAFISRAHGLVPGQIDVRDGFDSFGLPAGTWDAFLRDRATGETRLLSGRAGSPVEATGITEAVAVSADGRFAVFSSYETRPLLLLYDWTTGSRTIVNHEIGAPDQPAPGSYIREAAISADGRYVAYVCTDCLLVSGQQDGTVGDLPQTDVFLFDRATGANTLVSHASGAPTTGGNNASTDPAISADGRFVTFTSLATNLLAGQVDSPNTRDVFLFDRTTGAAVLASHAAGAPATAGGGNSFDPTISADSRVVAFRSQAVNLVPGQIDTNGQLDVFLFDRTSGAATLASHTASSPVTTGSDEAGFFFAENPVSLSADGRFAVFTSAASDLVAGGTDTNGSLDVFLHDRASGITTLVSHASGTPGKAADKTSNRARISADGRRIAFTSSATDLVPGQPANGPAHLVLQDRITGARTLAAPVHPSGPFHADPAISLFPRISGDGRFVAFSSDSPSLVERDYNGDWDVFLYDAGPGGSGGITPVPPCTLFDSRRPADGPALRSGVRKTLAVRGACGVPSTATAVVVEVTVPQPRRRGNIRLTPGNAILRFQRGKTRTGTFTVPLAADGTLALQPSVAGNGTVHAVIEAVGYQ
ncbi:MAG TPA: hypothetical protein VLT87_21880, partial [Thermoanaerobaculia bacterium]|nr:hypothetical protein [Thermoanaerobaculia bacterium]